MELFSRRVRRPMSGSPVSRVLRGLRKGSEHAFLVSNLRATFGTGLVFGCSRTLFQFVRAVRASSELSGCVRVGLFVEDSLMKQNFRGVRRRLRNGDLCLD